VLLKVISLLRVKCTHVSSHVPLGRDVGQVSGNHPY